MPRCSLHGVMRSSLIVLEEVSSHSDLANAATYYTKHMREEGYVDDNVGVMHMWEQCLRSVKQMHGKKSYE